MGRHLISDEDRNFRTRFEACDVEPAEFDHRGHVRLAYIYLAESEPRDAYTRMREALRRFIAHNGVDPTKYHDTMTRAWTLAVRHFMDRTPESASADAFIAENPRLLDSKIMLTHYSAEVLFSAAARARFVEPDLEPIPVERADRTI